jgi:YegS/Rv2252/BmrU family lipid kinase
MPKNKGEPNPLIKLIYNPNAGKKRKFLGESDGISLDQILTFLQQYQLPVDLAPTKGPKHATELAKKAMSERYQSVIVAGGDGTISEVANGLVDTDIPLGIIPIGSYMNIPHMLSIPTDIEKAIAVIKIGRIRKIDVGVITNLNGEKRSGPFYFVEGSGIGVEAHVHREIKNLENGHITAMAPLLAYLFGFTSSEMTITTDDEKFTVHTGMVTVANGPFSGAALELAPGAKLNDHRLTVVVYKMRKRDYVKYFLHLLLTKKVYKRELKILKSKKVTISATPPMYVHADASLFGTTPVTYIIKPSCLQVICGFPTPNEKRMFISRTYLDP